MNEQLAPFFERLARTKPAQKVLHRAGLHPKQFVLFLGLLRTLSEREEYMGLIGADRFAISFLAIFIAIMGALASTTIVASQKVPAPAYLLAHLAISFVMVCLFISREAANALFDPVEASMLSHAPVHSPTYTAAKIAHVMIADLYLVSALSIYPALIGVFLEGARWFWPITHVSAAFLLGIWTAFLVCASYGFLGRFAPSSWLKGIAVAIQLLTPILIFYFPVIGTRIVIEMISKRAEWLTFTWFAQIGLLGCQGASLKIGWQGAISMAVTLVIFWLGLRSFSAVYFAKTYSIIDGASWNSNRRGASVAQFLAGSPLAIGAFEFVSRMMRRDWQYRRAILSLGWMPVLAVIGIGLTAIRFGIPPPPISSEYRTFSAIYVLPHLLGLLAMSLAINLPFTDYYNGTWIYLIKPIGNLRAFARGIYWALWIPVSLLYLPFLPFMVRSWGWIESGLVVVYSLLVVSLYLGFALRAIPGMPFSTQVNEQRSVLKTTNMQMFYFCSMALVALQYFLWSNWIWAITSGIALAIAAWLVVRWAFSELDKEFRWRLHMMKMGPNQMFNEID